VNRSNLREQICGAMDQLCDIIVAAHDLDEAASALWDCLYDLASALEPDLAKDAFDQALERAHAAGKLGPEGRA
jgi:hypothetical protein